MKIVVAPNAFKESLDAPRAAACLAQGLRRVLDGVDIVERPIADGGDGTVMVLLAAVGGEWREVEVTGPLGASTRARFGLLEGGDTAVLEMAESSGLHLVEPAHRDPLRASTRGLGELIRAAIDTGCRRCVVGLGGSATVDAGVGAARALGARFVDSSGNDISDGGAALELLADIDLRGVDARVQATEIQLASDVRNPLLGSEGAARVYGPQKGASAEDVEQLEAGLTRFVDVAERVTGRSVRALPGAGAAGGTGAGLCALLGAQLVDGAQLILEMMRFDECLEGADLLITGEGRLDAQTVNGKAAVAVASRAQARGIPVVTVAGAVTGDTALFHAAGLGACFSILREPMALQAAIDDVEPLLDDMGEQLGRLMGQFELSRRGK